MTDKLLQERVDHLESQLAFQEDTIESLNQLVTAQSEAVYRLQQQLQTLTNKYQELNDQQGDGPSATAHEPPPHY